MTLCAYCQKDQGRRSCPALGGLISSTCCGKHRGVRINCPSHCKYYKEHEEYQRARLSPGFHDAWLAATAPLYQQRQAGQLNWIVFLEVAIFEYFQSQTRGTDEDLLEALEFLRQKLSPIALIEAAGSGLSQHLWESAQNYLKSHPSSDREKLQEGAQLLHSLVQPLADDSDPRHGLHGLLGHVQDYIGAPHKPEKPDRAIESPSGIILPGN